MVKGSSLDILCQGGCHGKMTSLLSYDVCAGDFMVKI